MDDTIYICTLPLSLSLSFPAAVRCAVDIYYYNSSYEYIYEDCDIDCCGSWRGDMNCCGSEFDYTWVIGAGVTFGIIVLSFLFCFIYYKCVKKPKSRVASHPPATVNVVQCNTAPPPYYQQQRMLYAIYFIHNIYYYHYNDVFKYRQTMSCI